MRLPAFEKIAFVLSVTLLAFLYGVAVEHFRWFPRPLIQRAWRQAEAARWFGPPSFTHGKVYDREGVRVLEPDAVSPGLTVIAAAWPDGSGITPGLRLIDQQGNVLHDWRIDPGEVFETSDTERVGAKTTDIHGSYLFPDGDVLVNLEYAGTVRLDACGAVRWKLRAGGHHSIARADDGTFWIPGVTAEARSGSPGHPAGFPGLERPVFQDLLLRISEDGAILDTINVLDVLYANGLEWLIADERRTNTDDPTHVNDVEPLPDSLAAEYPLFEAGDLVVSLRHLDLVFVLDPVTGKVKWHAARPFIMQHDPDFIGGGWIGVFDNRVDFTDRGTMLGGSRIVALQPHTDSMKVLFPTGKSEDFYTVHRGKWQMLPNGNMLLTEEEAGRVVEVSPDGRTVWEWIQASVEGTRVPEVTKATRVDLAPEHVSAWPCPPGTGAGP